MKYVYFVLHKNFVEYDAKGEEVNDIKHIGFYSTRRKAKAEIKKYKSVIGFRDYPKGFIIEKMKIDFDDYDFI